MANNFVDVITQAQAIATAFDQMSVLPFRPKYVFDANAQAKTWDIPRMPVKGDNITFLKLTGLSANTATLDTTAVAVTGANKTVYTRKSIGLEIYGQHTPIDTLQLPLESFMSVAVDAGWQLMDQAGASMDALARAAFDTIGSSSASLLLYGSSGTASNIGPMRAIDVRIISNALKGDNVPTFEDGFYRCILNSLQANQLRAETGNAAWRFPKANVDNMEISNGDIGVFEGFRFIISENVTGNGTQTISSYFFGKNCVGKAIGKDASVSTNTNLVGVQENILIMKWNALIGYGTIHVNAGRILKTDNTQK